MRYKAMFVVGFAAGFVAGARAGRERYDQLVQYGRQVAEHPMVQKTTQTVTTKTTEFGKTAAGRAPDLARSAGARVPKMMGSARQMAASRLPLRGSKSSSATKTATEEDPAGGQVPYQADASQSSFDGIRYSTDGS